MKAFSRTRWLVLILLLEAALLLAQTSVHHLHFLVTTPPKSMPAHEVRFGGPFSILDSFVFRNEESLKRWEEKVFKGKTVYSIQRDQASSFLRITSHDACSGLYTKVNHDGFSDLFLSWKWRAVQFPTKKDVHQLSNKAEDDFAARVYVIFPGPSFFKSDVIEYVWDEIFPVGTAVSSPYSQRIKLFVIRSGARSLENDGWQEEDRNIYQDYRQLFGKDPERPAGVVALMSDSDNTGTASAADFSEFTLKMKRKLTAGQKGGH